MNPAAPLIDLIDFDLVNAVIDCAQIFVVRSRDDAAHMRTEASLSDGAKSLVEDTVGDISDRSVLVQMKDRDLSIVETGDKDIVVGFAC